MAIPSLPTDTDPPEEPTETVDGILTITTKAWNNLIAILEGISTDKIAQAAINGLVTALATLTTNVAAKFNKSDIVTAFQGTPDDAHVPSEKLLRDTIDAIPVESKYSYDSGIIAQQETGFTLTHVVLDTLPVKLGKKAYVVIKGYTGTSGLDPTIFYATRAGSTVGAGTPIDTAKAELQDNLVMLNGIVDLNGQVIRINHNSISGVSLYNFSVTIFEI